MGSRGGRNGKVATAASVNNGRASRLFKPSFITFIACVLMLLSASSVEAISSDGARALLRTLQFGGFSPGTTFALDDTELEAEVLGVPLSLSLKNIECSNVVVEQISAKLKALDDTTSITRLGLEEFGVDCSMDYTYKYLVQAGSGSANIFVENSRIETDIRFVESPADDKPNDDGPRSDYHVQGVDRCKAELVVSDIAFDGEGPLQGIFNSVSGLLRSTVADQMETALCSAFGDLDEQALGGIFAPGSPIGNVFETLFWSDFLLLEQSMSKEADVELVNLEKPNSWMALALSAGLRKASSYLAPQKPSLEDGDKDLLVNKLIRELAFDGPERQLSFDLSNSSNMVFEGDTSEFGVATFHLDSVNITGLDSVRSFDGFHILGSQTLQADLLLEYLNVTIGGDLKGLQTDINGTNAWKEEKIALTLAMSNLNISAGLLLILDNSVLGGIPIGSLLDTDDAMECLRGSIDNVQLAGIVVNEIEAKLPSPSEMEQLSELGIEIDLARLQSALLESFEADGEGSAATTPAATTTETDLITTSTKTGSQTSCRIPISLAKAKKGSYLDFRNLLLDPEDAFAYGADSNPYGDLIVEGKKFLDEMFTADSAGSKSLKINKIIAPLLADPIELNHKLFDLGIGQDIVVKSIRFNHLDMIKAPSSILNPVSGEPYVASSTMSLIPLQVTVVFEVGPSRASDSQSNNNIAIRTDLDFANFGVDIFAKMVARRFFEFPIEDLFDVQCWLSTLALSENNETSIWFPVLETVLGDFNMQVGCEDCLDDAQNTFETFSSSGSSVQSINANIDEVLSRLHGMAFEPDAVNLVISKAPKQCRHRPEYDPGASFQLFDLDSLTSYTVTSSGNEISVLLIVLVVLVGLVALGVLGLLVGQRMVASRRYQLWRQSLSSDQRVQESETAKVEQVNALTTSMFKSNEMTSLVRWCVPIAILACSGLFLAGFLATSFTLSLRIKIVGEEFLSSDLGYSIAQLTKEMWNGGGRAIAVLTICCSAILPQVIQLGTLFLFACPGTVASASRRLVIMEWLNLFGKWTMAVVFIVIIACAAFRQTITSPIQSESGQTLYTIDILVIPVDGFYFWGVAQILSQAIGHFVVRYHHNVVSSMKYSNDERETTEQSGENGQSTISERELESGFSSAPDSSRTEARGALCKSSFSSTQPGSSNKLQVRAWVNVAVAIAGLAVVGLTTAGCIVPSIAFDVRGALAATGSSEQIREQHSVVSIAQTLFDEARFLGEGKYYFGLGLISIIWAFVILVVPIIHSTALETHWFAQMQRKNRQVLQAMSLFLDAHQYLEVYIGSAIASALQLQSIAGFFLGIYCDSLRPVIGALVNLGALSPEDAECFFIQGSIEYGSFLLLGAVLLLACLRVFVSKAVEQNLTIESMTRNWLFSESDRIEPFTLHFASQFRWFLRRRQT